MHKHPEYHNLLKYVTVTKDLIRDIFKYANEYVLLEWIDTNKINWNFLSSNPNAIYLLEQNQNKINWNDLSQNPNAIHLLEPRIVNFSHAKSAQTRDELREQNQTKII
jgi:hypothetical protein